MNKLDAEGIEMLSSMIDKSIKNRQSHNKPSRETLENLTQQKTMIDEIKRNCNLHNKDNNEMQINVATMKVDIDYIKKKLDEIVKKIEQVSEVVCGVNGNKAEKTELILLEKSINERLDKLEGKTENIDKWRIKMIVYFSVATAIGSFALHFLSQILLNKLK